MTYNSAFSQTGEYHLPPGTDVQVGDLVVGPGVATGTLVTSKIVVSANGGAWNGYSTASTYIVIELSAPIFTGAVGVYNYNYNPITSNVTGLDYLGWKTHMTFMRQDNDQVFDPIVYLPGTTLSFREDAKGWVSFKSFTPENAISCANEYYTINLGRIWKHHSEQVERNSFYNIYKESTVNVVFNDVPGDVKSFRTLNYEGSQARILSGSDLDEVPDYLNNDEYYNLVAEKGWFVDSWNGAPAAETNLEKGGVSEFIEKEGKWFGYFTGVDPSIMTDPSSPTAGMVVGGFNSADFSVQGIGLLASKSNVASYGCTDASSFNYDPTATIDDNTCVAIVFGCTNSGAYNYDPSANTDSGSCIIPGCTDSTAFNYDATANTDDGNCIAVVSGCIDNTQYNYDPLANTDDFSCVQFVYGCTNPNAFNYDPTANTEIVTQTTLSSCIAVSGGCIDQGAINYNATANTDDGSCTYDVLGCTDPTATNYGATVTIDDGSCIYTAVGGCVDPLSIDYNPLATFDDGSCTYDVMGCTNPLATNYDPLADTDDGSCTVSGCTDLLADNYDATATSDDGSCTYDIPGCTDPVADNYNATATSDNGSCTYPAVALGCTDPSQFNYDALANTDDGTCIPFTYGCTDSTASNYNSTVNSDDGSCIWLGCTDPLACNYDSIVTIDNGSCAYCGDSNADNTDSNYVSCTDGCLYCSPVWENITTSVLFTNVTHDGFTVGWTPQASYPNDATTVSYTVTAIAPGQAPIVLNTVLEYISFTNMLSDVVYTVGVVKNCLTTESPTVVSDVTTLPPLPVLGCTDGDGTAGGYNWAACNYDPLATIDDGSCFYDACVGCMDDDYMEYCNVCWDAANLAAVTSGGGAYTADDGSCTTFIVNGCTDPTQFNYDPLANVDDGSCVPVVTGCMLSVENNSGTPTSNLANYATNYNNTANTPGTCNFFTAPEPNLYIVSNNVTGSDDLSIRINTFQTPYTHPENTYNIALTDYGLDIDLGGDVSINSLTTNSSYTSSWQSYPGNTTTDPSGYKLSIPTAGLFNPGDTSIVLNVAVSAFAGGTALPHFTPFTSLDKTFSIGCTDLNADNGSSNYDITDNTQCEYLGCTNNATNVSTGNPLATNYDFNATVDDGSCIFNELEWDLDISTYDSSGVLLGNSSYVGTDPTNYSGIKLRYKTGDTNVSAITAPIGHKFYIFNHDISYPDITGNQASVATRTTYPTGMPNASTTISGQELYTVPSHLEDAEANALYHDAQSTIPNMVDGIIKVNQDFSGATLGILAQALEVSGSVDWTDPSGVVRSYSYPNILPHFIVNTMTMGCRDANNSYANWDSTLDLHQQGSCVFNTASGCLDAQAWNYDSSLNTDCAGVFEGNDTSCCYNSCPGVGTLSIPITPSTPTSTVSLQADFSGVSAISYKASFLTTSASGTVLVPLTYVSAPSQDIINNVWNVAVPQPTGGLQPSHRVYVYVESRCYNASADNYVFSPASNTVEVVLTGNAY